MTPKNYNPQYQKHSSRTHTKMQSVRHHRTKLRRTIQPPTPNVPAFPPRPETSSPQVPALPPTLRMIPSADSHYASHPNDGWLCHSRFRFKEHLGWHLQQAHCSHDTMNPYTQETKNPRRPVIGLGEELNWRLSTATFTVFLKNFNIHMLYECTCFVYTFFFIFNMIFLNYTICIHVSRRESKAQPRCGVSKNSAIRNVWLSCTCLFSFVIFIGGKIIASIAVWSRAGP
jgi:hypothetical protein